MATAVAASDVAVRYVTEAVRCPPPPKYCLWLLWAVSFEPEAGNISPIKGKDKECM